MRTTDHNRKQQVSRNHSKCMGVGSIMSRRSSSAYANWDSPTPVRIDEETQTIFRCLLSLPLLPVSDIAPGFQELKTLLTALSASSATTTQLFRYVERQWINKSTVGLSKLSVRDNPSRANNLLESFHAALRRRIKVSHPNLFAFLGHLQRIYDRGQSSRC